MRQGAAARTLEPTHASSTTGNTTTIDDAAPSPPPPPLLRPPPPPPHYHTTAVTTTITIAATTATPPPTTPFYHHTISRHHPYNHHQQPPPSAQPSTGFSLYPSTTIHCHQSSSLAPFPLYRWNLPPRLSPRLPVQQVDTDDATTIHPLLLVFFPSPSTFELRRSSLYTPSLATLALSPLSTLYLFPLVLSTVLLAPRPNLSTFPFASKGSRIPAYIYVHASLGQSTAAYDTLVLWPPSSPSVYTSALGVRNYSSASLHLRRRYQPRRRLYVNERRATVVSRSAAGRWTS